MSAATIEGMRTYEMWKAERAEAEASVAEIRRFLGWPYARQRPRDPAKRELLARIGVPEELLGASSADRCAGAGVAKVGAPPAVYPDPL